MSRSSIQKTAPFVLIGLFCFIVSAPFLWKACQRPDEPPPLSGRAASAALELARRAVERGVGDGQAIEGTDAPDIAASTGTGDVGDGQAIEGTDAPELAVSTGAGDVGDGQAIEGTDAPELAMSAPGPVLVTVYGVGEGRSKVPPMGVWSPLDGGEHLTLGEAVRRAGRQAGEQLEAQGSSLSALKTARIKIDIGGTPLESWSASQDYLTLILDPGRDGLIGQKDKKRAYIPPSWVVERGWWKIKPALRHLGVQLGGADVSFSVALFRTRAYVEGSEDEPGLLEVFRGNVLVPELSSAAVLRSLKLGGEYLARMVQENGKYCYTYFADQDRCDQDYNLLRHAGTTYSLYQIYQEVPDPVILEATERAADWLRQQVRPVEGDPSRVYMLEGKSAKLGALGLSLLAFVEREKVVKDGRDRALLTQMAIFVLSQQREDGYLESFFAWSPDVELPEWKSIYYPGEALLGLVRLYDIDPQARWLDAAVKSADFLALKRWRWAGIELYVPPDAWLTQALAELYPKVHDEALKVYTYELVEVSEVTMLRGEEGAAADLAGGPAFGFFMPGVTPAGARNEGLTAAYRMAVAAGDGAMAAFIKDLSYRSARFQLNQQFRPANSYFLRNPERAMGGFRSQPDKLDVRVDYVQHNATGLVGVLNMLREEGR